MTDELEKKVCDCDCQPKKKGIWENARDYLEKNPAEKQKLEHMRKGNKMKAIFGVGVAAYGYKSKNKMIMYAGAAAVASSAVMEYAYSKIFPKKKASDCSGGCCGSNE